MFFGLSGLLAQEVISYYPSSYYNRDFIVEVSYNKIGKYMLHLEIESLDSRCSFAGLRISEIAVDSVLANLHKAKTIYRELKSSAQRNNTLSLSQKLDVNTKVVGAYFKQRGKEYIDHAVKPKFSFEVETRNGRALYLLKMKSGRMISPIFEHIQCTGAEIVFSSEAEIDKFIDAITIKDQYHI